MRNTIERTVLVAMLLLALTASGRAGDTPEPQRRAVNHYITRPAPHVVLDKPTVVYADPIDALDIPLSPELTAVLVAECEAEGVPLDIALAVMERESNFNPDAVGPDGHDIGLFQIRDSNHSWLRVETSADPMTPDGNIVCGFGFPVSHLERLQLTFQKLNCVFCSQIKHLR